MTKFLIEEDAAEATLLIRVTRGLWERVHDALHRRRLTLQAWFATGVAAGMSGAKPEEIREVAAAAKAPVATTRRLLAKVPAESFERLKKDLSAAGLSIQEWGLWRVVKMVEEDEGLGRKAELTTDPALADELRKWPPEVVEKARGDLRRHWNRAIADGDRQFLGSVLETADHFLKLEKHLDAMRREPAKMPRKAAPGTEPT